MIIDYKEFECRGVYENNDKKRKYKEFIKCGSF